jgi:putative transposon-encoded protein
LMHILQDYNMSWTNKLGSSSKIIMPKEWICL